MPKQPAPGAEVRSGKRVYGVRRYANNAPCLESFLIFPGYPGAVFNGVIYSGQPVEVTPDAEGKFEVWLPPSSALGRYTVRMGEYTFRIAVPDDVPQVMLDEIVVTE